MKTKILIVDDSLTVRMELKEALGDDDVTCAASGEEAISLLAFQSFDIILMDLSMPGLSGLETCQIIKRHPIWRNIPLIILTAQAGREALIDCLKAGAADYVVKSEDFSTLKASIQNTLVRVRGHLEN